MESSMILLPSVQVVAGLDEGVATMKTGGLRRIYVPGNLSFPKGLPSGPGRYSRNLPTSLLDTLWHTRYVLLVPDTRL